MQVTGDFLAKIEVMGENCNSYAIKQILRLYNWYAINEISKFQL